MYIYRLAHPGGPMTTNKAAALAKFLERKLQEPNGLASIDPDLIELAVKNAKDTVISGFCVFRITFFLFNLKKKKLIFVAFSLTRYKNFVATWKFWIL